MPHAQKRLRSGRHAAPGLAHASERRHVSNDSGVERTELDHYVDANKMVGVEDTKEEPMKYKNLKELKAAYDSGELSRDNVITLDNDSSYVYVDDEKVYDGPGYELREEALDLLGIPTEAC